MALSTASSGTDTPVSYLSLTRALLLLYGGRWKSPPYGNRCRIKPGSTARTQTRWAANGTGIKPGSIAL